MGREGGKPEAKLPLMFGYCCSFSYLGGYINVGKEIFNSETVTPYKQAAGMNSEKEDSETLFLAKSAKSLKEVQVHNLTQ